MKKDRKIYFSFITVVVLTIIFCAVFLKDDIAVVMGQDLTFHLNRISGLMNAFEEGQILPKIYPYANHGFGYATPLFYCDLFLYPFAILAHFGVPIILCYKLCVFTYTLIGNVLVYFLIQKIWKKEWLSYLAVIFYAFANYHLQNVFIRAALGEILAMTWIPLVLYAIYQILVIKKDTWKILGISFSLLLMSHLISTLLYAIVFALFILVFTIYHYRDGNLLKKAYITILKGTVLAFFLTAWYLFPMLEQMHSQTFWLDINQLYNHTASGIQKWSDILKPFALLSMEHFDIVKEANIGLPLLVFGVLYLFVKKNRYITVLAISSLVIYLVIIGVVSFLPQLEIIQFLFRFYVILFPLLTIVSVYVVNEIGNAKLQKSIILIVSLFSLVNYGMMYRQLSFSSYRLPNNANLTEINSITNHLYSLDYNHDELGGAEYLPFTEHMNYNTESNSIKRIDENGAKVDYLWEYDRHFTSIRFRYEDDQENTVLLPLSYYKGYHVYEVVDGKEVKIPVINYELYKLVSFQASRGVHEYVVRYDGTFVQKVTLLISVVSFVGFVIYVYIDRKKVAKDE